MTWAHFNAIPVINSNAIFEEEKGDVQGGVGLAGLETGPVTPVINHHMDYGPRVYGSGVGYVRPNFSALREALNYISSHQNPNLFIVSMNYT